MAVEKDSLNVIRRIGLTQGEAQQEKIMYHHINVKSMEELIRAGGRYYNYEGSAYIDANSSSYRYVPSVGFVRLTDDGNLPAKLAHRPTNFLDQMLEPCL